jgi:hypothetical protein
MIKMCSFEDPFCELVVAGIAIAAADNCIHYYLIFFARAVG